MTLLLKEPWSSGGATAAWTSTSFGSPAVGGRNGYGFSFDNPTHYAKTVTAGDEHATFIVGFAVKTAPTDDFDADDNGFISFWGDAGATCHVYIGNDHATTNPIQIRQGVRGTVLASSASATSVYWPDSNFHYLEVKCTLSDTVGSVAVKVDGTTVATFSGDTKNGGTATVLDTIKIGGFYPNTVILDDLYFFNGAGSAPYNDFYGDPGDVTNLGVAVPARVPRPFIRSFAAVQRSVM